MKSLFVAVLLIVLAVPCIVAQQHEPKVEVDPNIRLMALFDTPGREWTQRVIHWTRGESPYVVNMHSRVDSAEGGKSKVTVTHADSLGGESVTHETFDLKEVPAGLRALADKKLPEETVDLGFRKFPCRKHYEEKDGVQATTWTSTEFHPLMVKQTVMSGSDYTVCKLSSFADGSVDPWLLYRKVGRSWTVKTTIDAGGDPTISYYQNRVTAVEGDKATCVMELMDKDRKPMAGMDPMEMTLNLVAPTGGKGAESASLMKTESKECEAGTFECYFMENAGTKTWASVRWPGLMVRMEADMVTSELIEFDLGHDVHEFYRTVGNSCTLKNTTKVAGFSITQSVRYEVTEVKELNVKYTMKSIDQNGLVTTSTEMTHTLPEVKEGEDPAALSPYAGQVEEMVYTPAGAFPAIRTEAGDTTMWSWNGFTIRTEMKTDELEMIQELSEMNIQ